MANSDDDFSQAISEDLTCPVCFEELKDPKNLNCPHNVCRECLERMPKPGRQIVCPLCKKHTAIPDGGVASLHTNVTLARLVEATLRRKAKIEIQKSLERGKPEVNLLEKKISDFEKALSVVVLDQERVENDIHENANQFIDLIMEQEASLCAEVVGFYDRQKVMIEREKNDLHKLYSDASKSVQDAEVILEKSSIDASEIRSVAEALAKQVETITQFVQEKSRLSISTLEKLEFNVKADADYNSIFQDGKFGKLTKGMLNAARPVATPRSYPPTSSLKESEELRPKAVMSNCPTSYETPSTGVTKSTQTKEIAANIQAASSNKVTKRSTKDNSCTVCKNKATHFCEVCKKGSCKNCLYVVSRLSCKFHSLIEGRPSTCSVIVKPTQSKEEAPSQKLHPGSHINEENICDLCGLAATLICKTCLKPVCNTCMYVYLCPPTKKEHQFENTVAQSSNTNGTPRTGWACECCTFWNSLSCRSCIICSTSRGNTRRCANCTYENEQGAKVCEMCSCTIRLDRPKSYHS